MDRKYYFDNVNRESEDENTCYLTDSEEEYEDDALIINISALDDDPYVGEPEEEIVDLTQESQVDSDSDYIPSDLSSEDFVMEIDPDEYDILIYNNETQDYEPINN